MRRGGSIRRLLVDDLHCPIDPEASKIMVKDNKVVVALFIDRVFRVCLPLGVYVCLVTGMLVAGVGDPGGFLLHTDSAWKYPTYVEILLTY